MEQLDLFNTKDREVWEELKSIQRSLRGLFARYNYLEREWIDHLNSPSFKNHDMEKENEQHL